MITSLVDLIFKGNITSVNLEFIAKCVQFADDKRFIFPENVIISSTDDIINTFTSNPYSDFCISARYIEIFNTKLYNIYINIGCDKEEMDILFFLDLKDINNNLEEALISLHQWAEKFKEEYRFQYFICRMDGEQENDPYYFKSSS